MMFARALTAIVIAAASTCAAAAAQNMPGATPEPHSYGMLLSGMLLAGLLFRRGP